MQIEYSDYVRVMAGEATKRQIVVRRFREVNEELETARQLLAEKRANVERLSRIQVLCLKAALGILSEEGEDPALLDSPAVRAVRELRAEKDRLAETPAKRVGRYFRGFGRKKK